MIDTQIIRSKSDYIWLDVTKRAVELWNNQVFDLFMIRKENEQILDFKIETETDFLAHWKAGETIAIRIGQLPTMLRVETVQGWDAAQKIRGEDGFMYIRAADLVFTKPHLIASRINDN